MLFCFSDNIIVLFSWKSGLWKITDFGLTAQGGSTRANTTVYARGTSGYRAPELIADDHRRYNNKVDIWALGCILYELLTGSKAFENDLLVLDYSVRGQKFKFSVPEEYMIGLDLTSLEKILVNMLDIVPFARKASEVLYNEFNRKSDSVSKEPQKEELLGTGI